MQISSSPIESSNKERCHLGTRSREIDTVFSRRAMPSSQSQNEADRYFSTRKTIVQYMGTKSGGDIWVTLESGRKFEVPTPQDPADNCIDFAEENGNPIAARSQVNPRERIISPFPNRKRNIYTINLLSTLVK